MDEESDDNIEEVYLGWANTVLRLRTDNAVTNFDQLKDGRLFVDIVKHYEPLIHCVRAVDCKENFRVLKEFLESKNIECPFELSELSNIDEVIVMDIIWTFILNFTICPGLDLNVEDKCIELGRCTLIEWLQLICPHVEQLDPDEEISQYFTNNRLLIDIIEAVFNTKLSLPRGSLLKELRCALLLVEEAFCISKCIIDPQSLLSGNCPEFSIIIYLSLLKETFLNQPDSSTRRNILEDVITEQPSKENIDCSINTLPHVHMQQAPASDDQISPSQPALLTKSETISFNSKNPGSIYSANGISESGFYSFSSFETSLKTAEHADDFNECPPKTFACSTPRNATITEQQFLELPSKSNCIDLETAKPAEMEQNQQLQSRREMNFDSSDMETNNLFGDKHNSEKFATSNALSNLQNIPLDATSEYASISIVPDSKNSTELQVTVIEKSENMNENASVSAANSKQLRQTNTDSLSITTFEYKSNDLATPTSGLTARTLSSESIFISDPLELPKSPTPPPSKTTPSHIRRVRQSPDDDPLMRLLDNIADKGQTLKNALNQSQLNTSQMEACNTDLTERMQLIAQVSELEAKNFELTMNVENLNQSVRDRDANFAKESRKVAHLSTEIDRLLDVNRSFREENLKMEEKIIRFENEMLKKNAEISALKNQLNSEAHYRETVQEGPSLVDVDEKDAIILGMQHELEEVLFEKSRLAQELENLREFVHHKEMRQVEEDVRNTSFGRKSKLCSKKTEISNERLNEMSETISKLEKSLIDSQQRNEALSERLDAMNYTHLPTEGYNSCSCHHSSLCYSNPLNISQHILNKSCPPTQPLNSRSCKHCRDQNEPYASYLMPQTTERLGRRGSSPTFHYFDRSVYEPTQHSNGHQRSSDECTCCPNPHFNGSGKVSHEYYRSSFPEKVNYPSEINGCLHHNNLPNGVVNEKCHCIKTSSQTSRSACNGDFFSQLPSSSRGNSQTINVSDSQTKLNDSKNTYSDEQSPSIAKDREQLDTAGSVSQSTREFVDRILAKYTNRSEPESSPSKLKSTEVSNNLLVPVEPHKRVEAVTDSYHRRGSLPAAQPYTPVSQEVRDIGYESLRKATLKLRDDLHINEESKPKNGFIAEYPNKLKTFDEFVQTGNSDNVDSPVHSAVVNSNEDLKPFLSRTLASAGVFLHDGNTDLMNRSLLASVRNPESSKSKAPLEKEAYRSAPNIATHDTSTSKFGALFRTSENKVDESRMTEAQLGNPPRMSDMVAEMGQRLRDGLRRVEGGENGHVTTEGSASYREANSNSFEWKKPQAKTMKNGIASNIEDEILTRYKRELRLIDDPDNESANAVVRNLHDSILDNLHSIRQQGEVYRSKMHSHSPGGTNDSNESSGSLGKSEVKRDRLTYTNENSKPLTSKGKVANSQDGNSDFQKFDRTASKGHMNNLNRDNRTEPSDRVECIRSSTPTQHLESQKYTNTPLFDVSRISVASSATPAANHALRSVQFYQNENGQGRDHRYHSTPTKNEKRGQFSGKLIQPSIQFA